MAALGAARLPAAPACRCSRRRTRWVWSILGPFVWAPNRRHAAQRLDRLR